jgi:enoyl-CoA hydratase
MDYRYILYSEKDGIAVVTMNRPEKHNSISDAMVDEMTDCFQRIRENANVRAVILTGSGDKAFAAGADIDELATKTPLTGKACSENGQRLSAIIDNFDKPVIAAVNGFALGGGCEMAMACHIRICSENAKFALPEVNLGVIPGYGGTQRLARIVGKGIALQMILTGDHIRSDEAYRIGLVNKVVPREKLMAEAEAMCRTIMSKGHLATKFALQAVNRGLEAGMTEGLAQESALFSILCGTEDKKEGLAAFMSKRRPQFKGN